MPTAEHLEVNGHDDGEDRDDWKSGEIETEHYAQVGTDIVNANGQLGRNTTISECMGDPLTMLRQITVSQQLLATTATTTAAVSSCSSRRVAKQQ